MELMRIEERTNMAFAEEGDSSAKQTDSRPIRRSAFGPGPAGLV